MSRPRIRTLKPETWQDERVGRLSRDARLLFVVLITIADDDGRFRALPAAIVGHGFLYDQDAARKLERWFDELTESGMVELYDADGVRYGWLPGWHEHQRINRKTPSFLPAPPGYVPPSDAEDEPQRSGYRKSAIPEKVRREVARRAGAVPGEVTTAKCHYCPSEGAIIWRRLSSGKPGSWVTFSGLELDHVEPEFHGGEATVDNIVLACMKCNRSKGHGTVAEFRARQSRRTV